MVEIIQGIYGGILLFASFIESIISGLFYLLKILAESVNLVGLFQIYLPAFLVGACSITFAIYILKLILGR